MTSKPDVPFDWEVLIPAYNAEETIGRAATSALEQAVPPKAVRIWDDASKDDTARLASRIAGVDVDGFPSNRGVGAARGQLLDRCQSEWLLVLDADDFLAPFASQVFARAISDHGQADVIAFGEFSEFDAIEAPSGNPAGEVISARSLWERNRIISSAALIRRSAAERVGGFRPLRRLVDYDLWLRMLSQPPGAEIVVIDVPVVGRRIAGGTITGDVVAAVKAELELLRENLPPGVDGEGSGWRRRVWELWRRGYVRHLKYGNPARTYIPFADLDGRKWAPLSDTLLLNRATTWFWQRPVVRRGLGWEGN